MRSFLTALLILSSVLILVFLNAAVISRESDELLLLCRETADGSAPDAADRLLAHWERCRRYFSLSTHYREIEAADSALLCALSAADPMTRDANLNLFAAALRRIDESQRFDLFNIL